MYGIQLDANAGTQDFQQEFYGLNRNIRRRAGEFYDMTNMTMDNYPIISPRKKRGIIDLTHFAISSVSGLQVARECFDGSLAYVVQGGQGVADKLHIVNSVGNDEIYILNDKYDKRTLLYLGGKLVLFPDMLQVERIYKKDCKSKGIAISAYTEGSGANTKYYVKFGFLGVELEEFRAGQEISVIMSENYDTTDANKVKAYNYLVKLFSTSQTTPRILIDDKGNNKLIIDITNSYDEVPTGYTDSLFTYFSTPLLYTSIGENELKIMSNYNYDYLKKDVSPYKFEIKICDDEGNMISVSSQSEAPESHNVYWYDTTNDTLKGYSSAMGTWVAITSLFIKISLYDENSTSIKQPFDVGEAVAFDFLSNTTISTSLTTSADVRGTIKDTFYIDRKQQRYYTVKSINKYFAVFAGDITLVKEYLTLSFCGTISSSGSPICNVGTLIPPLDYVCEGANRIWGCRYGTDYKGDFVNEIYCSGLGNFASWYNYEGASTDSFAVSLGADGDFRGCVFMNGRPSFFKENAIFTVYGDYPANFQLVTLTAKGIQKGSENSIALCSDGVLYKGVDGVYLFDGSSIQLTSDSLGIDKFYNATGAMYGVKYYVSMQDKNNKYHLYVLDLNTGYWVKEDDTQVKLFFEYQSMLFFAKGNYLYSIDEAKTEALHSVEDDFEWECETGILGYSQMENKYIGRFNFRMNLADKTRVNLLIAYDDSDDWENQGTMRGNGLQSYDVPVIPRRCDHFNIKVKGKGEAKIFSIGKMIYSGGTTL